MEDRNQVIFEIWRTSEKRCYFLLSSAGASIGYALVTLDNDATTFEKVTLVGPLSLWAVSFAFGLRLLRLHGDTLSLSERAVKFIHASSKSGMNGTQIAKGIVDQDAKALGWKVRFSHSSQVTFLLLGAIVFAAIKLDLLAPIFTWCIKS